MVAVEASVRQRLRIGDLTERYGVSEKVIEKYFLDEGLPMRDGEVLMETLKEWELRKKCIGCHKGLPGCGLLPAYKEYLVGRKRSPAKTGGYLLGLLGAVYVACFTPHAIAGYAAVAVFTVCMYDQSMRKAK